MAEAKAKKTRTRTSKRGGTVNKKALTKLWSCVPINEWLMYFREIAPDQKWQQASSSIVRCCCPYHDEKSPSFTINFAKGFARCFGSCEKYVSDPISLVAKLKNCGTREAQLSIYERFNLQDTFSISSDNLDHYVQISEMKKAAATAFQQVTAELIREDPPHLAYCKNALYYLTEVRKIPLNTLHALPVGIFAKPIHVKKYMPEMAMHQLYDEYFAKYNNNNFWGAIAFHYNDSPGSISRFKLKIQNKNILAQFKNDITQVPEHQSKLTFDKQMPYVEDSFAEGVGLFGLFTYRHMLGKEDVNAYVTEGEFDALSVMAAQLDADRPEFMILCAGGKGSTDISALREYGVKTAWLVPDHPSQSGNGWAQGILGKKVNFQESADLYALTVKLFMWPVEMQGFDLDEAVLTNGYNLVSDYIFRKRNDYFINATPWVRSLCDKEIESVELNTKTELGKLVIADESYGVRKANLVDERSRKLAEVIGRWFRYIHDHTDKANFIQYYATEVGVDISKLDSVNDSLYSLDTVNGVTQKIEDSFTLLFSFAYYERRASGNVYQLWVKHREELIEMNMQDGQLQNIMCQYAGKNIVSWLDNLLGPNQILLEGTDGKEALETDKVKRRNAAHLIKRATENLIHLAEPKDDLARFAQGVHYLDLPAAAKRENCMYFVNGKKIFRGDFKPDNRLDWTQLENIVDNNILFEQLNADSKWSFVNTTNDLEQATQIDLKDLFKKVRKLVDGWKFENHDVIAEYLTAYIMSVPVMRAVGDVNITYVTGEKESGKTSLVNGLLGGDENSSITPSILESAVTNFDASPAAMYQMMEGSSLMFVLDEAEFSNSHNTKHDQQNKEIVRMLYSMPMGGVTIRRGGATKDQTVSYKLRMPVMMAGINLPADSTFLSRVFVVYTEKDRARKHLGDYIAQHFSDEELEKIRHDVTLCMLPYIPKIITRRTQLREQLSNIGGEIAHISNRFLGSILTPLTVYDLLGYDAEKIYKTILFKYKDRLEAIHNDDSQADVITACLFSKAVKVTTDENIQDFVSARHLIMSHEYNILNQSDCGVYYLPDPGTDMIIIVWRQAKYDVLKYSPHAQIEEQALREQAQKSNFVIADISTDQDAYIRESLALRDVKNASQYTVLDAAYLITMTDAIGQRITSFREKAERDFKAEDEAASTLDPAKPTNQIKSKIRSVKKGKPRAKPVVRAEDNINLEGEMPDDSEFDF